MNDDYREPSLWKTALDINTYRDPPYWQTVKEDVVSGAARDRIYATLHAYSGIFAGAGQMIYGAKNPGIFGTAVATHGFGNYLGSIGNLSNTIYGTNYDWNYTRKGYEKTSEILLSNAKYGTKTFYISDLVMASHIALSLARTNHYLTIGSGVGITLERSRKVHAIFLQPASITANDIFSNYNNYKEITCQKTKDLPTSE